MSSKESMRPKIESEIETKIFFVLPSASFVLFD